MHEYLKRLKAAQFKGILDKGSVSHAAVIHDDWCGIFSGGECNCDPDILIRTNKGIVKVMADGTVEVYS